MVGQYIHVLDFVLLSLLVRLVLKLITGGDVNLLGNVLAVAIGCGLAYANFSHFGPLESNIRTGLFIIVLAAYVVLWLMRNSRDQEDDQKVDQDDEVFDDGHDKDERRQD